MQNDAIGSHPFHEPLRITLIRTGAIAIVVGAVFSRPLGGLAYWPFATLLALWPALGGHWIEVFFLNWLRPRLPVGRGIEVGSRLVVWFIGGVALGFAMRLTAATLARYRHGHQLHWWLSGLAFIGIELGVHLVLKLRGVPNLYDGRRQRGV